LLCRVERCDRPAAEPRLAAANWEMVHFVNEEHPPLSGLPSKTVTTPVRGCSARSKKKGQTLKLE
jgi:hypothetical protein